MKKVFVILSALVLCATTASAQSWLDDFLKVATEKVGDVISGKGAATTAFDIKGSWKYQGNNWLWTFTVPDGAEASVTLPGETESKTYGPGTWKISKEL